MQYACTQCGVISSKSRCPKHRAQDRNRPRGGDRGGRPWRRKVAQVVARDGGICWICGRSGATSADHIVPRHDGGSDDLTNLRAAHVRCNQIRGNQTRRRSSGPQRGPQSPPATPPPPKSLPLA